MFVPVFKGGKHESVTFEISRFLDSCQDLLSKASAGETTTLYRCFKTRLEGEAYERVALSGAVNFLAMKNTLIRAYGPQKRFHLFSQDVYNCTQKSGESTRDYLNRFERTYRMACSAARAKYQIAVTRDGVLNELEQIARYALKHGVRNPVLHGQLLGMRTENIEQLIEEANRFEREEKAHLREETGHNSSNIMID